MVTLLALTLTLPATQAAFDRRVAVSSTGRVASTVPSGTFVSGQGRVAVGGNAVAWSPDGQTLAISIKRSQTHLADGGEAFSHPTDDVAFWPSGPRLDHPYGLQGPLAWSPSGDRIAGGQASVTGVFSIADGKPLQSLGPRPSFLRWTDDGRLFAVAGSAIYLDNKPVVAREGMILIDAVPTSTGALWIETDGKGSAAVASDRPALSESAAIRIGRWDAVDGSVSTSPQGTIDALLAPKSDRRLVLPTMVRLAPGGLRGAVAGIVIESGPRSIARLRTLLALAAPSATQAKELAGLFKTVRKRKVVARADAGGGLDTLWTSLMASLDDRVTDLAFSPDGKWLAIAGKDGTVRVATGE